MSKGKSFWTTVPGILTGTAAVITAVGGLLFVLYQVGVLQTEREIEMISEPVREPEPRQEPEPKREPEHEEQPAGFRVAEVILRADPFDYKGPSPAKIKFSGRISVIGGNGIVSYKFLRSDGASAPIETLKFDAPGSKDVSTTWTLGGPGSTYSGWQSIKIFEPQEMESERANFKIQCD
jgi:hypothetical protein